LWWVIAVVDEEGTIVRQDRVAAVGPVDRWSWDGRDVTERVVDDGRWQLVVDGEDVFGNRGERCVASVVIDLGREGSE
jgi:hypothetical protein